MKFADNLKKWVLSHFVAPETGADNTPPSASDQPIREAAGATIDSDEDQWRLLSGDTRRDLSPMSQGRMRDMALYLWESNLLANRLIELPLAFLLAEGVSVSAEDANMNSIIEKFWCDPINQMDMKLPKKARELALYGEQCYPTFVNEMTGHVRLGYLDPALIATIVTDPDNTEQPIGIVTVKDKKGNAKRYRVVINGGEDVFTQRTQEIRATFTDGECFFFKVNDLSNGQRGRSDLIAQGDWIDAYDQFLFGELERVGFMRSFIWDVTISGATQADIDARVKKIVTPKPNSVRMHNESEVWKAESPNLQSGDTTESARLIRNHILSGATIPEHWSGGGGDVNRAVGAEMGEPTMKIFTMRQNMLKHMLKMIGVYVLRQSILATEGNEPEFNDPRLKVNADFPELSTKDTSKYASALQQVVTAVNIAVDKNLIDKGTGIKVIAAVAERLGVEIDAQKELENTNQTASAQAESDVFTTPQTTSNNQTANNHQ